ncbi:MAG: apolipoprotein N-acyltransferase, partial [Janthinobacterium sp.]
DRQSRSTGVRMLIAALAGATAILAFAPFGYWPLQIASLAILFYQILRANSIKRSFLVGWAFGFGWTAAGVHWLYIAMHDFGGMAAPLAALAVALLTLFLGAYAGLVMAAAAWLRRRWTLSLPIMLLLVLPALWAVGEWLRGTVFTGFPWVVAGYAHNISPLAGYAPLLGVYGLGWLAALVAGALLLLRHRSRKFALALMLMVIGAGWGLKSIAWTHAEGALISVRLLQGNVAQDEKFNPVRIEGALKMYQDAITAGRADLIALPETAVSLFPNQLPSDYLPSLARFAQETGSHVLLGIPLTDGPSLFSNSALGIAPASASAPSQPYRYDKHHLVPFGEFIPLGFRWFVDLMTIPLGDFQRGAARQAAFLVKDQRILPNICYEDLFGEEIAAQLAAPQQGQKPATLLLNISNLAWYGESIAIDQHLQISQMRTLETGRPMLRSTNSGATAIIDGRGQIVAQLAPYTSGTLAANVQGMAGMTPYILLGNWLFLGLSALALAAAWLLRHRWRAAADDAARQR